MDVGEIKAFIQEELSTFRKRIELEFLVFEKEMIERLERLARRQLNIGPVGDGRTVGDRTTDVFSREECVGMVEQDVDTEITVSEFDRTDTLLIHAVAIATDGWLVDS